MHDPGDTIVAIASAPGVGGRGIIRLSGAQAVDCVRQTVSDAELGQSLLSLRTATRCPATLRIDGFDAPVPCDLLVWPGTRSYTRQPAVEIHTLGSPPILQAVVRTVCQRGARLAAPGEFTLRAFLAGRLDLTQAEAVLGVIESRDRHELDVAIKQLAGGLGTPLVQLRDGLLDVLAHLEAGLDFVEEDIEFIAREELYQQVSSAAEQVQELVERTTSRAVLRDAVQVVLVGSPNVGKSSLFNALLGRGAALVSSQAGTTRDYLLGELVLGGLQVELVDTAGIAPAVASRLTEEDSPAGGIDDAAQRVAVQARQQATIELLCLDAGRALDAREQTQLVASGRQRIVVLTKTDQPWALDGIPDAVETSSITGAGLDELCARIRDFALQSGGDSVDVVAATAARCHESLQGAARALAQAQQLIAEQTGEELVAAELRAAIDDLGQVVGAVYTDDLLDRIFSRFCIGK